MKNALGTFLSLTFSFTLFANPRQVTVPESITAAFPTFEPSASIYLADQGKFLVASDDTNNKDEPFLFLVNEKGEVDKKPLKVNGLAKMTDIESISLDEKGTLYLLSSLSLNKNGVLKPQRNLFAKASIKGKDINVTESVDLRAKLLKALEESNDPVLKTMNSQFKTLLEIESSFVKDGELLVGLKAPQPKEGTALILNLGNADQLFTASSVSNIKVEHQIDFAADSNESDLLSDMQHIGNSLLLTTTLDSGGGRFWKYDLSSKKLTQLKSFETERPEAIAQMPDQKTMLFFDQGEDTALFEIFSQP